MMHLEGALRNGHSNITVSFLNTPPLRHVPTVKIIRGVQRSEVPDEGPPGAAAQASRMRLPSRKYWTSMSRASAFPWLKSQVRRASRSVKKAGMASCSDAWSQVKFGSFGFFWFRASLSWPPGQETP